MSTKQICLDARMVNASGIGTYLQGLLEGLRRKGPENFSFTLLGNPNVLPKGPWQEARVDSKVYSIREQFTVPAAFHASGAALLHAPHYNLPLASASRTIVTVHDLIHLKFPELWPSPLARAYARFFFHWVVPRAKAILTVSENTKRDLMEMLGIPAERITVIYNAVDHERFQKTDEAAAAGLMALGLPKSYFLYVGNLKEYKNVPRLVESYGRLTQRRPDSPPLVIVGRNFISGFGQTLQGTQGIRWLGEIKREWLPTLYQKALAFLFPSLYEGFGLPPLEAMAAGVPVMCSNRASLPEVVGDAALLVNPESDEEMTAAMERLLDDSELRKTLIAKGRTQAARFSWTATTDQTLQAYSRCLS